MAFVPRSEEFFWYFLARDRERTLGTRLRLAPRPRRLSKTGGSGNEHKDGGAHLRLINIQVVT